MPSTSEKNRNKFLNTQAQNNGIHRAWETLSLIVEFVALILKMTKIITVALVRKIVPRPQKSVKGEIVLITGAGHGIGRELALQYASLGAVVVCWDINQKGNMETIAQIAKLGHSKAHAYVCDVSNRNQVAETAKKVQKDVGDVSILINNAGVMPGRTLPDFTPEETQRVIDINLMAHFWTLHAFLPAMLKNNHGHVVTLSSCCGLTGLRNIVPYCASKFAVRGLTEALHRELRADPKCQVRCTNIYPYGVATGLIKRPKLRFPKLLALLDPAFVAKRTIEAQRRDLIEATIPNFVLAVNNFLRNLPIEITDALLEFTDSYVESDL